MYDTMTYDCYRHHNLTSLFKLHKPFFINRYFDWSVMHHYSRFKTHTSSPSLISHLTKQRQRASLIRLPRVALKWRWNAETGYQELADPASQPAEIHRRNGNLIALPIWYKSLSRWTAVTLPCCYSCPVKTSGEHLIKLTCNKSLHVISRCTSCPVAVCAIFEKDE